MKLSLKTALFVVTLVASSAEAQFIPIDVEDSRPVDRNAEMAWPFDLHGQTRRSMSYLKQGNAFDVLRSILNDVSRRRETRIGLNGIYNLLARTSVTLPSESGQADEILSDVLVQISKEYKLTWKLLIEPQEHFYVFNVVTVKAQPR